MNHESHPTLHRLFCAFMLGVWCSFMPVHPASALTIAIINSNPVSDQSFRLVSLLPDNNQTISSSTQKVVLTFSQPVKNERSSLKVLDMYGTPVDNGDSSGDGMTLSVTWPPLSPGKYTVKWRAHCRCGDDSELEDSYHFIVQ